MLKIDPDFKNLIPPLLPEEYKQLEQNIISEGRCRDAIVTWKNFIVDGHNRYAICQEHGMAYDVVKMRFVSKDAAIMWIIDNQLGRRNLTDAARIELACCKAEMLRKKARENLQAVGGDMREVRNRVNESVNVRKEIAAMAGVSEQKVFRYMKVVREGTSELVEQLRKGDIRIGTAYGRLQVVSKKVTVFYDDMDIAYRDNELGRANVLGFVERIGKLYGFLGDVVEVDGGIDVCAGIEKDLERYMNYSVAK